MSESPLRRARVGREDRRRPRPGRSSGGAAPRVKREVDAEPDEAAEADNGDAEFEGLLNAGAERALETLHEVAMGVHGPQAVRQLAFAGPAKLVAKLVRHDAHVHSRDIPGDREIGQARMKAARAMRTWFGPRPMRPVLGARRSSSPGPAAGMGEPHLSRGCAAERCPRPPTSCSQFPPTGPRGSARSRSSGLPGRPACQWSSAAL
jgi:hypothetical protein